MTSATEASAATMKETAAIRSITGISEIQKSAGEVIRYEASEKNNHFLHMDNKGTQPTMWNIAKRLSSTHGSITRPTVAKWSMVMCFWNAASSS